MTEDILLYHGDCLEVMPTLSAGSIDLILADLPYGTTACKWDTVIPFEPLWEQYKRLIKPRGAVVLFGSQPFTSAMVMSNLTWFKYCWYWKKERGTGFVTSNRRPLMIVGDVCVFYAKQPTYHPPKKQLAKPYTHVLPRKKGRYQEESVLHKSIIGGERIYKEYTHETPHQVLEYSRVTKGCVHPTQKPVALLEYLIRTYTNEGEMVLDNVMGSGSTGVACVNTNRQFVGIELLPDPNKPIDPKSNPDYFETAAQRIEEAVNQDD